MTKVVNLKHDTYDVYIGRGSKWGNPFIEGKDGTRGEVIKRFVIKVLPILYPHIHELRDKTLGCYCKPKPCHGDYLALAADTQKRAEELTKYMLDLTESLKLEEEQDDPSGPDHI